MKNQKVSVEKSSNATKFANFKMDAKALKKVKGGEDKMEIDPIIVGDVLVG